MHLQASQHSPQAATRPSAHYIFQQKAAEEGGDVGGWQWQRACSGRSTNAGSAAVAAVAAAARCGCPRSTFGGGWSQSQRISSATSNRQGKAPLPPSSGMWAGWMCPAACWLPTGPGSRCGGHCSQAPAGRALAWGPPAMATSATWPHKAKLGTLPASRLATRWRFLVGRGGTGEGGARAASRPGMDKIKKNATQIPLNCLQCRAISAP